MTHYEIARDLRLLIELTRNAMIEEPAEAWAILNGLVNALAQLAARIDEQPPAHREKVPLRSREVLDEFSEFVAQMKAKVAAKKEAERIDE